MNTQSLKLISDLKELYHTLFNNWIETKEWSVEFDELWKKIKLLNVISKKIEEQEKWLITSKVDYSSWWEFFLQNYNESYETLFDEINKLFQ